MDAPHDNTALTALLEENARAELARISATTRGSVGIAARHMQTGRHIGQKEDERHTLASTVKMGLALAICDMAERGEISLSDLIEVRDAEMTSSGPLGGEFVHPGVALSVRNLLEITITHSCNTATDVLFRVAGGTGAVARYLDRLGIKGFEVARTMRQALCVLHELPLPSPDVSIRDLLRDQPPEVMNARERTHGPDADYHHDQRDHTTPRAMLELLRRLYQTDGVTQVTRDLLLPMMERCRHHSRLRARLPLDIIAGNKGGSGAGTAADVGYVTLPEGRGTYAAAVHIMGSPLTMAERERALADISRLLYDYFLLITPRGIA